MRCYCHTIPKYENDIKKIRKSVVYFRNILACNAQHGLVKEFTEQLIIQCQQEIVRLEHSISDMEECDIQYHQSEAETA